jgi:hypothetical protein
LYCARRYSQEYRLQLINKKIIFLENTLKEPLYHTKRTENGQNDPCRNTNDPCIHFTGVPKNTKKTQNVHVFSSKRVQKGRNGREIKILENFKISFNLSVI